MSEIPPTNDPNQPNWSAPPQPQFAGYTRPGIQGNPEMLLALKDSYFGFQWVFLGNVVILIAMSFGVAFLSQLLGLPVSLVYVVTYSVTAVVVGFLSLKPAGQYAIGLGREPSSRYITALVLALQSWFCCGIIGYAILQNRALTEMKKYGIRAGFFGVKSRDVEATVAQMRAGQSAPPPPGPPPGTYPS